jgi:hypothetical protein
MFLRIDQSSQVRVLHKSGTMVIGGSYGYGYGAIVRRDGGGEDKGKTKKALLGF